MLQPSVGNKDKQQIVKVLLSYYERQSQRHSENWVYTGLATTIETQVFKRTIKQYIDLLIYPNEKNCSLVQRYESKC